MSFTCVFEHGGFSLNPTQMWFLSLSNPSKPDLMGLRVGIPNLMTEPSAALVKAVRALLASEMGAETVRHEVHHLEVGPLPANPEKQGYVQLSKLPTFIDWRKTHECKAEKNNLH